MGSKRFGGVLFIAHPDDHDPRHVHAFVGEGQVIVELGVDQRVAIRRARGAKPAEINKVVKLAMQHFDELVQLWEKMRRED